MNHVFKGEDGQIYQVIEKEPITIDQIEDELENARQVLAEWENVKALFLQATVGSLDTPAQPEESAPAPVEEPQQPAETAPPQEPVPTAEIQPPQEAPMQIEQPIIQ